MQIKRAFISAFKNRVFLPNFQKGNKKRRKLLLLPFFTTVLVGYLLSAIAAITITVRKSRTAGFMFILELNQFNIKRNTTIHIRINMIEANALLPMERFTSFLNKCHLS